MAGEGVRWAIRLLACSVLAAPAHAADPAHPDWPCVQRKVTTLTAAQMWDGPALDDAGDWATDETIRKLVPTLVARRQTADAVAPLVARFAESQPDAGRDGALKRLFAGVLETINKDRAVVMAGIERLQRRQRALALEIEREGAGLHALQQAAAQDAGRRAALAEAEETFSWNTRIFAERQQTIPIACEVPVQIEQRAFDLAREIRALMKE